MMVCGIQVTQALNSISLGAKDQKPAIWHQATMHVQVAVIVPLGRSMQVGLTVAQLAAVVTLRTGLTASTRVPRDDAAPCK
jgi:hypothetical protein